MLKYSDKMLKRIIFILVTFLVFTNTQAQQLEVQVGSGTSTNSFVPLRSASRYSMTQSVYDIKQSIEMPCSITSLSYYCSNNSATRNIEIYMAESDISNFAAKGNALPEKDFKKVFAGSFEFVKDKWNQIVLDSAFDFKREGNLVIAFRDITGSTASYVYFQGSSVTQSALYYYNSSTPGTFDNFSTANTYSTSYHPNIKLTYVPMAGFCGKVSELKATATENSAVLSWNEGWSAIGYTVYYKKQSEETYTEVTTPTNSVTITDLDPASTYSYYVVSTCESNISEQSSEFTFKTACLPTELPIEISFDDMEAQLSNPQVPTVPCWDFIASSNHPYISDDYAVSMENSMRFANNSYFILPFFKEDINTVQLQAKIYSTSANYGISVGVISDPSDVSTFEEVKTINVYAANTWTDIIVNMREYNNDGHYIAIKGNNNYVYVDDIVVKLRDNCEPPVKIEISEV